jgi:hypothetical protein
MKTPSAGGEQGMNDPSRDILTATDINERKGFAR